MRRPIAVVRDATLLSFDAPKQFPDSWIRVQLDDEFGVDGAGVNSKDADVRSVGFASLDDLSAADFS